MYMHYAGGGVGHYKLDLCEVRAQDSDDPLCPENPAELLPPAFPSDHRMGAQQEDFVMAGVGDEDDNEEKGHEGERDLEEGESDTDSESEEGEEEFESEENDDGLGVEDGEGGFEDPEDDEGYAAL